MTGLTPAPEDRPYGEQLAHLRLLERAAAAANQCATLEEAVEVVLREVCAFTGWPVGHLYVATGDGEVLEPTTVWHLADPERFAELRRVTEATPLMAGVGLPGRILATGRPAWITDVRRDDNFPRAALDEDIGVRAAFGFPIPVGNDVAAVLEFFAEEAVAPDSHLLELMAGVGHHLARVVERGRATAALRESEERYRAVTRSARDAIVTADAAGRIVSVNPSGEETFGYRETEVVGAPLTVLMPARFRAAHEAGLARLQATGETKLLGRTVELAGLRRDGTEFPLELSLSAWETAEGRFYTGIIRDISERRKAEREREAFETQLVQRALHDPLTGAPNRALLQDRLEQALVRAARRGASVAVVCLDLDGFKVVNDGFGHHVGDALLEAVVGRVQGVLGAGDTVARVGGDEFAVLCEEVTRQADAVALAERVERALAAPFVVEGQELDVTSTMGVAVSAGPGARADQLLRDAEVAMEEARRRGRGQRALYEESMRTDVAERLALEQDLRAALRDGQLRLHYQPIVDLATGSVSGVEALVRWAHPHRGLLPPQQFIALAEETGLIVPLGRWVLEEACRQGAAWQRQLGLAEGLRVSVNVSARQFQQPDWRDEVAQTLLSSGFTPGELVLEITESVLMEDIDTASRRMGELRALGVRIAIDDFGTGYSSLGYLRQFPVDILKVDKSFIDGVAEGPHESALARAVIKLASTLKMDAVAEGVSTRRQMMTLRRLRCRFAQGYYFARPQPPEAIEALISGAVALGEGTNGEPEGVLERPSTT